QVFCFALAVAQVGLGLEQAALHPATLKDRDAHDAADTVGGVRVGRRQADVAVIGVHADRGDAIAVHGVALRRRGLDAVQRRLIIGTRAVGAVNGLLQRDIGIRQFRD